MTFTEELIGALFIGAYLQRAVDMPAAEDVAYLPPGSRPTSAPRDPRVVRAIDAYSRNMGNICRPAPALPCIPQDRSIASRPAMLALEAVR